MPYVTTIVVKLYVSSENQANKLDAFRVVFHKLFYHGLSPSICADEYI